MTKSTPLYQGQKFHKLTVVKLNHIIVKRRQNGDKLTQEYYLCKCDCGKEIIVEKSRLTKNVDYTDSCGCSKGHIIKQILDYTKYGLVSKKDAII